MKIISGGQSGVDRAALDVAMEMGFRCGGWCPKGRRAEDGPIDEKYPLRETSWEGYPQRTEWNVRDSDGTLILTLTEPDRGTALTVKTARKKKKPHLEADPADSAEIERVLRWIRDFEIETLNVAGPRESSCKGIYQLAREFLEQVFSQLIVET